jgi:hypothetical protein
VFRGLRRVKTSEEVAAGLVSFNEEDGILQSSLELTARCRIGLHQSF